VLPAETSPPAPTADELLARRADSQSFGLLYERHLPSVYRFVSSRVLSREEAEDLTSEAFRQAWTSRRGYRGRGSYRAWLFSIVRRTLADHYRRHRPAAILESSVASRLLDTGPTPEDEAMLQEQQRQARSLLNGLSQQQLEVLSLRFAAELTYSEIGVVIGKREDAVKKIAYRALEAIRGRYVQYAQSH
jgi:RNA polymerase sigma-70 factor (ECF subfamily)